MAESGNTAGRGVRRWSSPQERRSARRMPVNRALELTMLADETTPAHRVKVRAMDVSRSGLGVVTRTMLEPGMRAAMSMVRSNGTRAMVGVEVMHAHVASDGADAQGCAAGLRFFKLPEATVKRVRI